jgi:signal transduction histidine kinase
LGLPRASAVEGAERRQRSDRFIADLAGTLATAATDTVGAYICRGLKRLAQRTGADRCSLATFSDGAWLTIMHSCGSPAIPTGSPGELPWYLAQLRQGVCLRLSLLPFDLPAEATDERKLFHRIRMRSHLAVPLFTAGRPWGVIALAAFVRPRIWTDDELQCLRTAGEIMMGAMLRGELEETVRRQQHELAHVTRVATLGDLTAALAHELNQPLAAICANAQTTRRLLSRGVGRGEFDEILADIVADATRAADLIRRLVALIRRKELEKIPVDMNQAVLDIHAIARAVVKPHGATLVLRLAPGLPRIKGDPVHLQQVVLNLVRNAAEAMTDIEPEARRVVVVTAAGAGQVIVSVEDIGPRIEDAAFNRLFAPFHTTKPQGLGIGLALSRAIAEAHGGALRAERRLEGGLVMRMTLPVE